MSKLNKGLFTSNTDLWATPIEFFRDLDARFHFTLDPCATKENHKCDMYYTIEDDGLKQNWGAESVLQSTIRTSHQGLGEEMPRRGTKAKHVSRDADSSAYRYIVLSRLHLSQGTDRVHSWAATLQRSQAGRTVPFYGGNF